MIFHRLRRVLKSAQSSQVSRSDRGFTLIELLVTVLVASGILSGLLLLTNELLRTDERESNRTETQRDMQLALNFISSELREAVFVYEADCLNGRIVNSVVDCPGLSNDLLRLTDDYVPVLAFWKLTPLSDDLKEACANGNVQAQDDDGNQNPIFCLAGNYYSLVVYSLGFNDPGGVGFKGKAGLYRTALEINDVNATGYVSPLRGQELNFRKWPDGSNPTSFETVALVDFVDDGSNDLDPAAPNNGASCPENDSFDYQLTPQGDVPRSFYACVSINRREEDIGTATDTGLYFGNQDVVLYLRGNAAGRSGLMGDNSFLPTLESRVFVRGAIDRP